MKDWQSKCGHIIVVSKEFGKLLEVQGQNYDHTLNVEHPSELYDAVI